VRRVRRLLNLENIRDATAEIKKMVEGQVEKLIDRMSQIADAAVPRQPSQQDVMAAGFMQMLFENPQALAGFMRELKDMGVDFTPETEDQSVGV